MPRWVIGFLLGNVFIQQLPQLPADAWLIAGIPVAVCCVWKRTGFLLALLLGMGWAILYGNHQLAAQLSPALEGKVIVIEGRVVDLPKVQDKRTRFDFEITHANIKLPAKIRLNAYSVTQKIQAGQTWRFAVSLKRPHGMLNAGGFDYETWLFSAGIGATGTVRTRPAPQLIAPALPYSIQAWRQALSNRLTQLLPHSPRLGIIKALSIGEGNEVSQRQWRVFRRTGIIHLVVISGSHISLIAGFVFFIARAIWIKTGVLRFSPHTVAAVVALFAAVLYSALAGFSVPTERAMLMVSIVMLGIIYQRHISLTQTTALALGVILLVDPLAVLSIGFWLSFISVLLIVYCTAARLGGLSYFFPIVNLHLIMGLALAPLLLFYFQQISFISPLANFIAVPVVEFITVPLILASLLLFPLPPLASFLLLIVDKIWLYLYFLLEKLAQLPLYTLPQPSTGAMLLAMLGMLLVFAPKGIPARWLAVVLWLPLLFKPLEKPKTGDFTLSLLDVGQGLAAVVQTQQHWLVFDTGAKLSEDFEMGTAVVLPFLYSVGAEKIDRVIISHSDNDHSGGLSALQAALPITRIDSSEPELIQHPAVQRCTAGQTWLWDGVQFAILSPPAIPFSGQNNNSCVLKIASASGSVLLTGDIESEAEQHLVSNMPKQLLSQVIIAPHHGSKTSSSLAFLQQVNPQLMLIPAGYKNRYHFPHQSVLTRYQQQQIPWLITGETGSITVRFSSGAMEVSGYRKDHRKYWYSNTF